MRKLDPDVISRGLLSDDELANLLVNSIGHDGKDHITEAEAETIVGWATDVRLTALMLDLVIKGEVYIAGVKDDEPIFVHPKHAKKAQP